jgi:hypothetical protein
MPAADGMSKNGGKARGAQRHVERNRSDSRAWMSSRSSENLRYAVLREEVVEVALAEEEVAVRLIAGEP